MATYYYNGTSGNDYLNYTGPDTLFAQGYGGDDFIWGNNGDDTIFGYEGNDTLKGWNGNDYLYGNQGNDKLEGENGNDFLAGYEDNDTLLGGAGNDTLGDWYHGEPGNDLLDGGEGNDVLYGYGRGTEYDTLTGGGGADKFVLGQETNSSVNGYAYYLGLGYATITDFNWQEGDKIQAFGSINDYSLGTGNWSGNSDLDTGIYYQGDLIAVVQDKSGSDVLLGIDFNFVT
ncbi:MAG: calcium-binding protein [Potamolinea sp.]